MKNKTIAVIGGAGFIGSHANKMLNQQGYQTIVFDNLNRGDRSTIQTGRFFKGDLNSKEDLENFFKDQSIAAVMHFAAFIDVGESVQNPFIYYQNNVCGTLNLLNAMIKNEVKTFIFSSSAAVYGTPLSNTIAESHPTHPINPYGETKLVVEKILRDFDVAYGLRSCSLRYFNAAGGDPEGKIKYYQLKPTNLIPIILRSIKKGETVKINGTDYMTPDGTCVRDYIHIEDLGQAHILAMEKLWQGGQTSCYNLGNGEGYSIKQVLATAEMITGQKVKIVKGPRRPGDPPILIASAQKAIEELKWNPRYKKLETMIEHAWKALNVNH